MASYALIADTLRDKFFVEPELLSPDAEFEALELDSLVLAELAVILTKRLGVQVTDDRLAEAGTVGGAAAHVDALLAEAALPAAA